MRWVDIVLPRLAMLALSGALLSMFAMLLNFALARQQLVRRMALPELVCNVEQPSMFVMSLPSALELLPLVLQMDSKPIRFNVVQHRRLFAMLPSFVLELAHHVLVMHLHQLAPHVMMETSAHHRRLAMRVAFVAA